MDDWQARTYARIQAQLERDVPPLIRQFIRSGDPVAADYERIRGYARYLGEHGDAIIFYQQTTSEEAMRLFTEILAVASFCPGGISSGFGPHFDADVIRERMRRDQAELQAVRGDLDQWFS